MGKFIKKKPSTKTANFKMYKAGKHWLFTFSTLTFLAGGAGFVFSGNQAVHADSNDNQRVIDAASAQTAASIHTAPTAPSTASSSATTATPATAAATVTNATPAETTITTQPKVEKQQQTQQAVASAEIPVAKTEASSSATNSVVSSAAPSSAAPVAKAAVQSSNATTSAAAGITVAASSSTSSATSIAVTQAAAPASSETENNHTKNVVVSKTLAAMPVVDDAGTPSTVVFTKTNPRGTATVTAPNVSIFAGDTSIDKVVDSNFTAFGNGSLATFTLAPNWVITGSTAANNIDYTHPLNPFASDGLLGPFLTFQNSAGTVGDMLASQVGRPNDANVPIWIAGSSYKTPGVYAVQYSINTNQTKPLVGPFNGTLFSYFLVTVKSALNPDSDAAIAASAAVTASGALTKANSASSIASSASGAANGASDQVASLATANPDNQSLAYLSKTASSATAVASSYAVAASSDA
ncbi:Ser/Ala-rich extracellular protein, LPXTG-anchored, partial [Lacticaseibacillus rhamnosus]